MILENWDEKAKEIVKGFSTEEMERLNVIIAMNIMIRNIDYEGAYMTWIYVVPNAATENALFNEAVVLFKELWENYAAEKNGFHIGGKLY